MEQTDPQMYGDLIALAGSPRYKVARSDIDPRGWGVVAMDGREIGVVSDLIADTRAMRVRHLVVPLDSSMLSGLPSRRVLLPVSGISLDHAKRQVRIESLDAAAAAHLPEFIGLPLTYDPELPFRASSAPATTNGPAGTAPRRGPERTRIRIERKGTLLPWVAAGAAALIVFVWGFVELLGPEEDIALGEPRPAGELVEPAAGAALPPAVQSYLDFVQRPTADMGVHHEYTAEGIRRLSQALEGMAAGDADIQQVLAVLQQSARQLEQSDWRSLEHADMTRQAFLSAANLLESIREARAPEAGMLRAQSAVVRHHAEAISADQPLLEQQETVEAFFRESGRALRGLAREVPVTAPAP